MAILLLVNNETIRDGLQYLGDVVGVFPDDHKFSDTELLKFDTLTVKGSVADVRLRLEQITPTPGIAYLWESDNKYHWRIPEDGAPLEAIDVFQVEGSTRWYKAENDFKFPVNIDGLTQEEKQLLATIDINNPSVDSFIKKIVKDILVLSGNDVEIKDLRNTSP